MFLGGKYLNRLQMLLPRHSEPHSAWQHVHLLSWKPDASLLVLLGWLWPLPVKAKVKQMEIWRRNTVEWRGKWDCTLQLLNKWKLLVCCSANWWYSKTRDNTAFGTDHMRLLRAGLIYLEYQYLELNIDAYL